MHTTERFRPSAGRTQNPMKPVDVTVIIPAHNSEETIGELLDSVLSTPELAIQVIVVDDCSSDSTAEMVGAIAERDPRVSLLRHETNHGAGIARNTGFAEAEGRFTLFFDDDDVFHPEALVTAVRALERGGQDVAVLKYRYRRAHDDQDQAMTNGDEALWSSLVGTRHSRRLRLDQAPELLGLTNYPWNRVLRTSTYRRAGLRYGSTMVNNDILGHWYSLLFADQILLLNEVLCTHSVLPGGTNLTNRSSRDRLSLLDALDETYDLLRAHPSRLRRYSHHYWSTTMNIISWAGERVSPDVQEEFALRTRRHLLRISIPEFGKLTRCNPALATRMTRRAIG